MLATLVALADAGEHVKDYDASLGGAAWILVGVALVVAVVTTWLIVPKGSVGHH